MPWNVVKLGKKFAVENKMTGKIVGRHDTKQEATSQVKALYSKVKDMPGYKGTATPKMKQAIMMTEKDGYHRNDEDTV